jgi:tetratricopeptide (TPR) repeat protein
MRNWLPWMLLCFPFSATAQHYVYEGDMTFVELSGKDCGAVKAGDVHPVTLAVEVTPARISGYYQIQGVDPVSFSGTEQQRLSLINADQQGDPDSLTMQGLATNVTSGEYRSATSSAGDAGCALLRGWLVARQSARGPSAQEQQRDLAQRFDKVHKEIVARQRDPQSYDEIVRVLPEIAQAEQEETLETALQLRTRLQPLFEQTYGVESSESFTNLNARARLHERLEQFGQALELRKLASRLAKDHHPQWVAVASYNLGDVLENLGRKEEALAAFAEATRWDEKRYGPAHPEVASDLSRQARLLEALHSEKQAAALYQRILDILQKDPESKEADIEQARYGWARARDPQTFAGLEKLAAQLVAAQAENDLQRAILLRQQMFVPAEKLYGKPSGYLADLLVNQADNLETLNRDREALALYPQALALTESSYGQGHLKAATVLNNFAYQYKKMGRYPEALPLYQRALAIREKVLGSEHVDTVQSLNDLAAAYRIVGRYEQALPLYQRALEIRKKVLGDEHADTVLTLNGLATVYEKLGQYEPALQMKLRALVIRERTLGPEHRDTAASLSSLADLYETMGQYEKALPLYQRALAIHERELGAVNTGTASSLNNLAYLYQTLGQYDLALALYQRALAIDEQLLGPDHPETATGLNNLAFLYKTIGQYDQALPLYQRAQAICEKTLGAEHPDTVISLSNLAGMYDALGQHETALSLYQRTLSALEKILGPEHINTATAMNNLAIQFQAIKDNDRALQLYQRALVIREKALGDEHAATASSLSNLASFFGEQHQAAKALPLFQRATAISNRVIQNTFPVLTEQQKLQFAGKAAGEMFGMLSLIHQQLPADERAVRAGLDLVLYRKGIVFDAQARQQEAIARSLNPQTRKLWEALAVLRSRLTKLMQAGADQMSGADKQKRIADVQKEIGKIESDLAGKSALVAQELKQRKISSLKVAQKLGKGSVLAEFVKIQDYDWEHAKWAGRWRYLVFILHADGHVKLVDLGEASQMERSVQAALKPVGMVGSSNDLQQDATQQLYQHIWQPMAAAIGVADKVVFSPDGLLNLVPFAAMQDSDGHYLVESRQISYVTSGRDLTKGDLGIKPETELYLAANPQFDGVVTNSQPELIGESATVATRSAGFGMHFSPLPGTLEEAEQIPVFIKGKHTVLTGAQATEDSVLQVRRPRVMHLSTHGFFLADQAQVVQGTRGAASLGDSTSHEEAHAALPPGYENPLVRSGLAFTGANHAGQAQTGRDGLLTALEVSGMDLHGTDLVTLSACETGRGEVRTGEGVFGLRRAFALAGTAHLMMSLWPVSDEVTAQQMRGFYQRYGQHATPAAALRQAQLATIAELRSKHGYAEPALWAPFIVQGR